MPENPNQPPHPDVRRYLAEWDRWKATLDPYNEPLRLRPQNTPCTEQEDHFIKGYVFWTAMIGGDIFGKFEDALLFRCNLEAIGATKSLAAIEALIPLHEQFQRAENPGKFWDDHKNEIRRLERLAETPWDFARLLLTYAETHLRH